VRRFSAHRKLQQLDRVEILHAAADPLRIGQRKADQQRSRRNLDERSNIRGLLLPAYRCAHAGYLL
jgi:hypothetical protein